MPGNSSWDGKWSGDGLCYVIIKDSGGSNASVMAAKELIDAGPFTYNFGDGWLAQVDVKHVDSREAAKLRKKSVGFAGYDWMVDDLLTLGRIRTLAEKVTK